MMFGYRKNFLQNDDCNCALCVKIRELMQEYADTVIPFCGAWCDPRRMYLETEDEFISRVPDGILKWPEDHIDPVNKVPFMAIRKQL